jgi:hypothetical protein
VLPQHLAEHGAQRHRVDRRVEQIVTGPAVLLPHQRVSGTMRIARRRTAMRPPERPRWRPSPRTGEGSEAFLMFVKRAKIDGL